MILSGFKRFQLFFITVAAFLFSCASAALAQIPTSNNNESDTILVFNPLIDNIVDKLPPLEVLIDSAIAHTPYIKMEEAEISVNNYLLQEKKKALLNFLFIDGDIAYGSSYDFSTNESTGSYPTDFSSNRFQSSYRVGLYLRIPIFEFTNYGTQIKIAKRNLEKGMLQREQKILELKQDVIFIYQDLIMYQEKLKVKNQAQLTTTLQVQLAEKEFLNGKISIAELSRLTEHHASNLYSFVEDRNLFYKQYLLLEQIVGMKFNLLNEID